VVVVNHARQWGAAVLGSLLARSLRATARTATLRVASFEDEQGYGDSCAPLADRLLREAAAGHVIVPFWSAQQLVIALLAAERFGLGPALERFDVVHDDSFGGEMVGHVGDAFGLRMRCIHTRASGQRLADVSDWLRDPTSFFIAVDGGSPYGSVPTGIIRLAARLGSTLWPLAVQARPALRCPGLVAALPLRSAWVGLASEPPLRVERRTPVAAAADELKRRLDTATDAARALSGAAQVGRGGRQSRPRQRVA